MAIYRQAAAFIIALGGLFTAASLSAQGEAQRIEVIEEITVTAVSRRAEGLSEVNAAVSVLAEDELQLVRHSHYQEALNRLPGVNVHRNNGQESLAAIRSPVLTGAGACGSFLVAENGIPLRSHGFCNVNEMFDAHSENAARIEVVRGPGSAFWGSNAVHGVINVVLPQPGEAGRLAWESGPRGSYRLQARIGSGGSGSGDNASFKYMLLFNGANEEGWRDDSGVAQQKLSYLYGYRTGALRLDGGFTINNLNQETAGYVVGDGAYSDDARRATNPNPEAYRDSFNGRAWTSFRRDYGDRALTVTPYFREVNMSFIQHFLPGQPVEDTAHRSFGLQTALHRSMAGGASLATGFDVEATAGELKQFQPQPTRGSAFLRNTIPQGRHYDYEVNALQAAAFVNYQRNLSPAWDISLGLRVESIDYQYDNLMLDGRTDESGAACGFGGCRYNRPADREDGFLDISPKLGLRYTLDDDHSLQLRVQRGFRAPQATELYRLQNAQTVADLDSVELDSYELALSGSGSASARGSANARGETRQWHYSLSLYLMEKENEIITNSARENLNGNHTAHRGFEAAFDIDLSSVFRLRGTANFARHTYENSQISGGMDIKGLDVDSAPRVFGNMGLQWRPNERLFAELEWVHSGDYYTNPENTASYPGHDLYNLRVNYRLSDDLSFALNLLNLIDKKYAERADWTTFTADRYFPGQPLRAHLTITWNWL